MEERRAWLAYIGFSTLLSDHPNRRLRRDAGLAHADYSLLSRLSVEPDGTLSMSEPAERLKVTRSRAGRSALVPPLTPPSAQGQRRCFRPDGQFAVQAIRKSLAPPSGPKSTKTRPLNELPVGRGAAGSIR